MSFFGKWLLTRQNDVPDFSLLLGLELNGLNTNPTQYQGFGYFNALKHVPGSPIRNSNIPPFTNTQINLLRMKKMFFSLLLALGSLNGLQAQVVISEIMYNPPESGTDSLEYLELVNIGNNTVDLTDWSFSQGINYTFVSGTSIPAGGYLVIAKSASAFQSVFGVAPSLVWGTNDALTNGGEDLELRDSGGNVVDYVDYKNALPWPPDANGLGGSLVLCDFTADNALPANWQSATTGTGVIINNNGRFIFLCY